MNLLLCTNGHPDTRPALEYGAWLAAAGRTLFREVVLLGVVEKPPRLLEVEEFLAETERRLAEASIPYVRRVQAGRLGKAITPLAQEGTMTVVGPMTSRLAWARTLCQLLTTVATPVLHVAEAHMRLERMLLCTGGLRYAEGVVRIGGWLARAFGATVTLLNVVEPVTLEYPVANQVKSHWSHLLETDTPQARRLREALETLRGDGRGDGGARAARSRRPRNSQRDSGGGIRPGGSGLTVFSAQFAADLSAQRRRGGGGGGGATCPHRPRAAGGEIGRR